MALTTYADTALNQLLFGDTSYTVPATLYVALSTTTPSATKGSAPYWNFTEPSGNAYARVAVTNNTTNFHAYGTQPATGQTQSNATSVAFAQATGSWGTVTYVGIFDAATNGNLLWFAQLTVSGSAAPQTINAGDTLSFAVDALQLELQ